MKIVTKADLAFPNEQAISTKTLPVNVLNLNRIDLARKYYTYL
jgi:hypothetical protein